MATRTMTFESGHEEMIHDAQLDYYGKRLATCSSDRTIRIFELTPNGPQLSAKIAAHDGPIWQIAWGHPKFGPILASVSYDGRCILWKEMSPNQWLKVFETSRLGASMNSVSFAPHSFGLILAAAASDGTVTIATRRDDGRWDQHCIIAHKGGVNAVSWGPDTKTGALLASAASLNTAVVDRWFVTAGCDHRIRIWRQNPSDGSWEDQSVGNSLTGSVGVFHHGDNSHSDWVRDVAWAPSLGLPSNTIASAGDDQTVILWYEGLDGLWTKGAVLKFDSSVWRVSWSVNGNVLAVSQGDQKVSLWKESGEGEWKKISTEAVQE